MAAVVAAQQPTLQQRGVGGVGSMDDIDRILVSCVCVSVLNMFLVAAKTTALKARLGDGIATVVCLGKQRMLRLPQAHTRFKQLHFAQSWLDAIDCQTRQ